MHVVSTNRLKLSYNFSLDSSLSPPIAQTWEDTLTNSFFFPSPSFLFSLPTYHFPFPLFYFFPCWATFIIILLNLLEREVKKMQYAYLEGIVCYIHLVILQQKLRFIKEWGYLHIPMSLKIKSFKPKWDYCSTMYICIASGNENNIHGIV